MTSTEGQVSRLASNTAILMASQLLNTALATVVAIVLVRYLGQEEYGLLSTTFAYLSFFTVLSSAGVDTVVTREVSRRPEDASRIISEAAGLRLFLSTVSLLISWLLLPLLDPSPRLVLLIGMVTLSLPLSFYSLFLVGYAVQLRMGWPKLIFAVWSLLFSGGKLGLVALGAPLELFVGAEVLSAGVTYIIARKLGLRAGLVLRIRLRRERARELLREAWPIAATLALIQVYLRLDQVMLYRMVGAQEVGLYAVGVRFVELLNIVPVVFMGSLFPVLSRLADDSHERMAFVTRTAFRTMAWVALPLAAGLHLYGPATVVWIFGEEFQASGGMLTLLAWSLPFVFANSVLYNQLFSTGRQRLALNLAMVAAGANVLLNVLLIPGAGGRGAAMATLASYALVLATALMAPDARALGGAAARSLVLPTVAVAVPFLPLALRWDGRPPLWGAPVLVLVYGGLLILFRDWGPTEWRLLRRAAGRPGSVRESAGGGAE